VAADGGAKFRGEVYFNTSAPLLRHEIDNAWFVSGMPMAKANHNGVFGGRYRLNNSQKKPEPSTFSISPIWLDC